MTSQSFTRVAQEGGVSDRYFFYLQIEDQGINSLTSLLDDRVSITRED